MREKSLNIVSSIKTLFVSFQQKEIELFLKKNEDYGESFLKHGLLGVLIRASDKIDRAINLLRKQNVVNESLDDTLIDLANYCKMALICKRLEKL